MFIQMKVLTTPKLNILFLKLTRTESWFHYAWSLLAENLLCFNFTNIMLGIARFERCASDNGQWPT